MYAYNALTEKVPGAVFEVANTLGPGFLEKVCERALKEMGVRGTNAVPQSSLSVHYKRVGAGDHPDLLMANALNAEVKCAESPLIDCQKPAVEWRRVANNFVLACEPCEV
jgi:GxxExxY protein